MPVSYADYEDAESTDSDAEIIFGTHTTIEATVGSVFGAGSEYGQSLGINFTDVELLDGCFYVYEDQEKFKLFSWKDSNNRSIEERIERDEEPHASDAQDFISKTYVDNNIDYELIAARVPEVTDDDGNVLVEASSVSRDIEQLNEDGTNEFTEFEDHGGDPVSLGEFVTWYDGNSDSGPTTSAQVLAETLTEYGERAVADEDDIYNWLHDSSGENVLRDDLEDRRVRFFTVVKPGDDYTYNLPIIEDVETGERIQPDNRAGGGTGNSDSGASEAVQEAAEQDAGTYPDPIAEFISSGRNHGLTRNSAENILDQLIEEEDNAMTLDMVEDHGGRDAIIDEVV